MPKVILCQDMSVEGTAYYWLVTLLKKANKAELELIYEFAKNLIDNDKAF